MTWLLGGPETPATHPTSAVFPSLWRGRTAGRVGAWPSVVLSLAIVVSVLVSWSTPAVRQVLRQSVIRLPTTYTELHFTRTPAMGRGEAVVPISLVMHGSHEAPRRLHIWLATVGGQVTATTTVTVTAKPNTTAGTVVRLPLQGNAVIVNVALLGHAQTLHYRLDRSAPSVPRGTQRPPLALSSSPRAGMTAPL